MTPEILSNVLTPGGTTIEDETKTFPRDTSSNSATAVDKRNRKPEYVYKEYEGDIITFVSDYFSNSYKYQWGSILIFTYFHIAAIYGLYLQFTCARWATILFAWIYGIAAGFGITAGSHRLWSHRSYKAKWPLRLILAYFHTIANQKSLYKWVQDHRSHHKFSETDADPFNAKRGMFFAHIGWHFVNKHPDVIKKGKAIDMSDIENDPIASFQSRYFFILGPFSCFVLPTLIPWYFWGEDFMVSWYICACMKFTLTSNFTWLVNSVAHSMGDQPYDMYQTGTDNVLLKYCTLGEAAQHNYHHAFPWDYATVEIGLEQLNITQSFIDFFCLLGWAYDRKIVPVDVIKRRILKTGDGSHRFSKEENDYQYILEDGDGKMREIEKNYAYDQFMEHFSN